MSICGWSQENIWMMNFMSLISVSLPLDSSNLTRFFSEEIIAIVHHALNTIAAKSKEGHL